MNNKTHGYIESDIRTDNKELRSSIIERINKYAKSIKHHPYKNLGNEIKFNQIKYCPSYYIRFQSQFDIRHLSFQQKPYYDEDLPEHTYKTLESVDIWAYEMLNPEEFINDSRQIMVDGSQFVETCHKCNGNKKITCPQCSGERKVICPICSGTKKSSCSNCGGSGQQTCGSCGGSGQQKHQRTCPDCQGRGIIYQNTSSASINQKVLSRHCTNPSCSGGKITTTQTCSSCHGSGRRTCSSCDGSGQSVCSTCGGRGEVTCPKCSGAGRITCPVCEGQGKLLNYIRLSQSIESDSETRRFHHNRTILYREFYDKSDTIEGELIDTITAAELTGDRLPLEFEPLADWVQKYWQKQQNRKASNRKICLQQIDIYVIPVYIVSYSFKGKKYTMLFYGSDLAIVADKSPIYDIAVEYTRKSEEEYSKKKFSSAKKYAENAKDMGLYDNAERIDSISKKVDQRLNLGYKWGIDIAFTLLMLAGGAVMFQYFSKVNYMFNYVNVINFPDNFLYQIHVWVMLIFFIAGSFLTQQSVMERSVNTYGKYFPSIWQRVIVGGVLSIVGMAFWSLFLAFLNATGIFIGFSFAGWLIIKILAILLKIALFILAIIVGIFAKIF